MMITSFEESNPGRLSCFVSCHCVYVYKMGEVRKIIIILTSSTYIEPYIAPNKSLHFKNQNNKGSNQRNVVKILFKYVCFSCAIYVAKE